MELRVACEDHHGPVRALDPLAFVTSHRQRLLQTRLSAGDCWIVEEGGTLRAYALRGQFFGLDFLELLYVGEAYRGHGIASALISAFEQGRRTVKVFTSTNRSNMAMQALLEKRDYATSGMIYNLDSGDPEMIFVKRFDGVIPEADA